MKQGWTAVAGLAPLVFAVAFFGCGPLRPPTAGAVVVSCDRGEAADVAGVVAGDVVVGWRQGDETGAVESPFHLANVEQVRAPTGPVELTVRRGWKGRRVVLPTGRWRVHLRPVMNADSLAHHLQAQQSFENDDVDAAVADWRNAATAMIDQGRILDAVWFHLQAGVALAISNRAEECLTELSVGAEAIEDRRVRAAYWERAGDALLAAGRRPAAAHSLGSAIGLLEDSAPESPALAFALIQLCRTNLRVCNDKATRAKEIYQDLGEGTLEYAQALTNVGAVDYFRSNLDAAEERYQGALDVVRRVAIGSPFECELLGNLGLVAIRRGDLDTARELFRREMEVAERLGPDTPQFSYATNFLGLLAKNMGRYEEARQYYEQALASFNVTRPGGTEVAGVLTNLANVALLEGNLEAARRLHEEALRLRQKIDPESADVAASFHNVGTVARWQHDLETGRRSLENALELKERFSPGSAWMANTLFELGEIARLEDRLDEAEHHHLRALEIYRRVSIRHLRESMSLLALGAIERSRDRLDVAEELWREAIALIEERRQGLQITEEERTLFGSRYYTYYGSLAGLLVDDGREIEAWDLLERARARALREVIAHRGARPAGVPQELWFAKTQAERQITGIENRLAQVDPTADPESLLRYRNQLNSAETQLDTVMAEIRTAAPRYSALSTPEAVTFSELSRVLDEGTVVMSYSVGEERSMVLVTGAGVEGDTGVQAFDIPVGAPDLVTRLNIFHSLIARGRSVDEVEPAFIAQARKLFNLLVGPAFDVVSAADRVLIVPDGPLVDLPFSALILPGESIEYLGHRKPLFFNPSASVFAELRESRSNRPAGAISVAAFGDPDYPEGAAVVDRYRLEPLPGSRDEIKSIEGLFGLDASTFLNAAATETNFRQHARGSSVLHCAVHAVADPRFPMDSALFFSIPEDSGPGAQDGVLWAWEIADELEIDAEVVVLSACGTGRGRAVAGEGIFGLARAFQYAGARTLVASQWEIPDRSTAELMARFYSSLKEGSSTAEALRIAQQLTAESTPAMAHPFHWASFQVRGDWR